MTPDEFRQMVLSLPGTEESPHFDRRAFRVTGRKIFATLHEPGGSANLVLSLEDQSVFSSYKGGIIYPVPNKWGMHGWTTFELKKVPRSLMRDALQTAYQEVVKAGRSKPGRRQRRKT
jgi:predicted DNA-binding protein (MmcQ/YjbR family)